MPHFGGLVLGFILGVALMGFAGCAGDNDGTKGPSPVPTAPATSSKKVTLEPKSAELPELPPGAGEMDPDAPHVLTPTASGLYYRILRHGDGPKPKREDGIVVNYKGWLDDGRQFDSSYGKQPLDHPLGRLIPGWIEGIPLIGEGGMIELEIPSDLGYGPRGFPPDIPPGATLHFIVELLKVKPAK